MQLVGQEKEIIEAALAETAGSFTSASMQRVGRFELARGGTIFLDEIGEIPVELQSKFLRVLQEREFEGLGGTRTLRTDARVVAATNRDRDRPHEEARHRATRTRRTACPSELSNRPVRDGRLVSGAAPHAPCYVRTGQHHGRYVGPPTHEREKRAER